jgi:NitT/TauT family transport system ATP-binding protein
MNFPAGCNSGWQWLVLINEPEIVLADEPFAALDEHTRRRMQDEFLRIWEKTKKTVVFVTHSIEEAIFLADRIVVMSARPGRVQEIVPISVRRPRDRTSPEFVHHMRHILSRFESLIEFEERALQLVIRRSRH